MKADIRTFDEDRQIEHARENLVVKDNILIQNVSRQKFTLSVLQQKCLGYIISKIKPTEEVPEWQRIEFDIRTFCEVCGIEKDNGGNYKYIKEALEQIADHHFWINDDKGELLFQWITTPYINRETNKLTVDIAPRVLPYLCALKERFTQYELWQILGLRGKYSTMIFEICKSYAYRNPFTVSLDDLYKYLGVEGKYKEYKEFNRRVLTPATTEINKYTSINVTYEGIREGRKIGYIKFTVVNKELWDGHEAYRRVTAELHGVKHQPGQMNLFEGSI